MHLSIADEKTWDSSSKDCSYYSVAVPPNKASETSTRKKARTKHLIVKLAFETKERGTIKKYLIKKKKSVFLLSSLCNLYHFNKKGYCHTKEGISKVRMELRKKPARYSYLQELN